MSEEIDNLNPRQRKFVNLYVGGMPAGRAYEAAGYAAKGHSADVNASRLLTNADVQKAEKDSRRALSELNRWEKWQLLDMLQNVLETPVGKVDEMSVLAQEVTRDEVGGGLNGQLKRGDAPSGNEVETPPVTRVKVKMFGKKDAAKMMADMMGWNTPQKVEVDGLQEMAEAIAKIGSTQGTLPEERM